jgi:hypothetical protein
MLSGQQPHLIFIQKIVVSTTNVLQRYFRLSITMLVELRGLQPFPICVIQISLPLFKVRTLLEQVRLEENHRILGMYVCIPHGSCLLS